MPPEIGTKLPRCIAQSFPAQAAAIGFDGAGQQVRSEFIVSRRDRHRELASRSGVDLGRTASPRSRSASRPLVGGRQQAEPDELVQVIGSQSPSDPDCGGGLVPAHWLSALGHKLVQASPDRVIETAQCRQAAALLCHEADSITNKN